MVLVQNWPYFYFFFQLLQARKMCFTIVQNEKAPFQAIKTACSKSGKIAIFAKVLVQNWPFFHLLFLGNIGQEKVFYDILEGKNAFLGYKNSKFKKWKNFDFSKGVNPWFWWKIGHFSIFCFQAIQDRKKCFTIFQNEKMPFQIIKTTSLKSGKISIFPKGLTHGFGPKLAIFPSFVFRQYRPGKCVLRYSRTIKRPSRFQKQEV